MDRVMTQLQTPNFDGLVMNAVFDPGQGLVHPATATAASKPCELYAHTDSPKPVITQGHHIHPVYLQNEVWGQIKDNALMWLCGLCHDAVHAWLYYLTNEREMPNPMPGLHHRRAAQATFEWYVSQGGTRVRG